MRRTMATLVTVAAVAGLLAGCNSIATRLSTGHGQTNCVETTYRLIPEPGSTVDAATLDAVDTLDDRLGCPLGQSPDPSVAVSGAGPARCAAFRAGTALVISKRSSASGAAITAVPIPDRVRRRRSSIGRPLPEGMSRRRRSLRSRGHRERPPGTRPNGHADRRPCLEIRRGSSVRRLRQARLRRRRHSRSSPRRRRHRDRGADA